MGHRRAVFGALLALALLPAPARAAHRADGVDTDWRGTPSYIAGASRYSHGEFVYSDYVHDDAGANVDGLTSNNPDPPQPVTGVHVDPSQPTSPVIGGAADNGDRFQWSGDFGYPMASPREYFDDADVLEFREALDGGALHFLVRLGALSAPDATVVGIGIDADRDHTTGAGAWPRGANMTQQLGYDYFVTLWGTGGELTDYTGKTPKTVPVKVAANAKAQPPFIEADVPLPAGLKPGLWRTYVGAGLWDAGRGAWAMPAPSPQQTAAPGSLAGAPYIYNLLFRPYEPNSWWRETAQADDLAHHDIAADHATIDARALARGETTPAPRPTGLLSRQYRTMPLGPGSGVEGVPTGNIWRSPVEPYSLTVPSDYYRKPHGRRFMFFYHCAFCQQSVWAFGVEHYATPGGNNLTDGPIGTQHIQQIVDSNDMLVAGALQGGYPGAGSYGGFPGFEERDLRNVEDDIRARYDIDPNRIIFSGMSMGGSTTKTMSTLYPDELAAAVVHNAPGEPDTHPENLRNVPYFQVNGDTGLDSAALASGRQGAQDLDARGYRSMYVEYLSRAHDFSLVYDSVPILEGTAYREVRDPDPPRVTYALDAASEDPKLGLVHDHAYWVRDLKLPSGADTATVDATALPLAGKLPKLISHLTGHFLRPSTSDAAYVDWQVWDRDLTGRGLQDFDGRWTPGPDVSVTTTRPGPPEHAGENAFTLTTGFAAETLELSRMGIETRTPVTGYLDASAPTALTLAGKGLGEATLDGKPADVTRTKGGLTVAVPAGKHQLVARRR